MGIFYTKKGDKGYSYVGKKEVYKLNPFVVALGELDQLNSLIGVVKSLEIPPFLKNSLHQIQENLFIIQANVAYAMLKEKRTPPSRGRSPLRRGEGPPHFSSKKTKNAEDIIDRIEKQLKPVRKFVVSGTTPVSAWLDYLRAFSRSVERSVLAVVKGKRSPSVRLPGRAGGASKPVINPDILLYLNRLSSLFFALARWEARGKKEY